MALTASDLSDEELIRERAQLRRRLARVEAVLEARAAEREQRLLDAVAAGARPSGWRVVKDGETTDGGAPERGAEREPARHRRIGRAAS